MARIHNLGFPRIGAQRELKFALEKYWQGTLSAERLTAVGAELRARHWALQAGLDLVPVGDFSLYDHVLDTSFLFGNIPARAQDFQGAALDNYFRVARGRSGPSPECDSGCSHGIAAGEMTKWFDTNYHYIVPEFGPDISFSLNAEPLLAQLAEAKRQQIHVKPVLVGPLTYLALGKGITEAEKLALLPELLPLYVDLLNQFADAGIDWVQIDEPILVTEVADDWRQAFQVAYSKLDTGRVKLLLTTYFGRLGENLSWVARLPVQGIHLDALAARDEVSELIAALPADTVVSLGTVNGRNVWKTDLNAVLDWLEPLSELLGDRLWVAPSCSLLHVPVDLASERALDPEVRDWLAFACQKLTELEVLGRALNEGRSAVAEVLAANDASLSARRNSPRVHNPHVRQTIATITPDLGIPDLGTPGLGSPDRGQRQSSYAQRAAKQAEHLQLPRFPTTTIGSFPQTAEIRQLRARLRKGDLSEAAYNEAIKGEIEQAVRFQEELGLDVFVHGEAERNDMVEYFGEQLDGYVFSQFGWVQSYGSRCVKPPILFGDISRPAPMTVEWTRYAQSLTDKPVKGMLTGPVTILNWSFVRDDQPRSETCYQLALAVREEVQDLERAGVRIIQIDEAALREGLPLRREDWADYLTWAIESFRVAANGVRDETQIHTHMCYSEFNDIIESIAQMDADVITIETARSNMELLGAFDDFDYPNEIGPGVYDIHSPNIPDQAHVVALIREAARRIPAERLWVNPDCGLKTRRWEEVKPALAEMVAAARVLRETVTV